MQDDRHTAERGSTTGVEMNLNQRLKATWITGALSIFAGIIGLLFYQKIAYGIAGLLAALRGISSQSVRNAAMRNDEIYYAPVTVISAALLVFGLLAVLLFFAKWIGLGEQRPHEGESTTPPETGGA